MVDFRRIAILEPSLIFPRPFSAMAEKEIISHTRQWAEGTLKNGADAWYFRFHRDYEFLAVIQRSLTPYGGVKHLVPYPAREYVRTQDGIHIRGREIISQTDIPVPGANDIGISCHSIAGLHYALSHGFNYAFFSPIFTTESHPAADPKGLETLRKASKQVELPIFALGGINSENEEACLEAGAWGIAGIRMFLG